MNTTFLLHGFSTRQPSITPYEFRWEMVKTLEYMYEDRARVLIIGKPYATVAEAVQVVYRDSDILAAEQALKKLCEYSGIKYDYIRRQARAIFVSSLAVEGEGNV